MQNDTQTPEKERKNIFMWSLSFKLENLTNDVQNDFHSAMNFRRIPDVSETLYIV